MHSKCYIQNTKIIKNVNRLELIVVFILSNMIVQSDQKTETWFEMKVHFKLRLKIINHEHTHLIILCDTSCACANNEQYKTYKLVPKVDRNSRLTFLFCEKEFQIDCHRTKIFISEDFSNLWIGKRISEDFSNLWIGKRVSEAQPSSPSANIVPFGPVKHPRCSTGN